ncbi:hypothetical protein D3C80_1520910 [compost metagenome]
MEWLLKGLTICLFVLLDAVIRCLETKLSAILHVVGVFQFIAVIALTFLRGVKVKKPLASLR